jgi:hypothetical protein
MSDAQDRAEALDDDKLGGEFPPERPLGADEGRTDEVTESFEERDARHLPDDERRVNAAEDEALVEGTVVSPQDEVAETPEAAEEAALRVREVG